MLKVIRIRRRKIGENDDRYDEDICDEKNW